MPAKAILSPKSNSSKFNAKTLDLSVPVKIGRANKEDRPAEDNGYFDCKVLSKPHAMILYQAGLFYILDTGSSNGSFINNVRLSKAGAESELTEVYTGDIIRFGSDVVDKSRNVTQKCAILKLRLINEDGTEYHTRPSTSKLYRQHDALDDVEAVTKNLQESLAREKVLEEKLNQIVGLFDTIKDKSFPERFNVIENEISKILTSPSANLEDKKKFENLRNEKALLRKENLDLEETLRHKEAQVNNFERKISDDAKVISSLGQVIHKLRQDVSNLETVVVNVKQSQENIKVEYETKIAEERRLFEEELDRVWRNDKDLQEEKMRLEEKILCLESESCRSSVLSTPTTVRTLDSSLSSGLSTPTSALFLTQDESMDLCDSPNLDKSRLSKDDGDLVRYQLETTKRELDMIRDENVRMREEMKEFRSRQKITDGEGLTQELERSREEIQYLLRKITEKDDQLEVMESKLIQIREEYASLKDKENCAEKSTIQEKHEDEMTKEERPVAPKRAATAAKKLPEVELVKSSLSKCDVLVYSVLFLIAGCFIYYLRY